MISTMTLAPPPIVDESQGFWTPAQAAFLASPTNRLSSFALGTPNSLQELLPMYLTSFS